MRTSTAAPVAALIVCFLASSGAGAALELPWRQAGLTERQAAAHLLARLTYGARPGDVDRLLEQGLDDWLEEQLDGGLPSAALDRRLAFLDALDLPARELAQTFPPTGLVLIEARQAGVLPTDVDPARLGDEEHAALRARVRAWAAERGYRPERQLIGELLAQKVFRARYSENQLREVLTDFWSNHFNVPLTDNLSRPYVLAYERDAIRPRVLGSFRDLLGATARHPAMLLYLDNARSTATDGTQTTMDRRLEEKAGRLGRWLGARLEERSRRAQGPRRSTGLNENYARELLELHTLGVEGGYTQQDVVEVARAFTGWAALPPLVPRTVERRVDRARRAGVGFVVEDAFVFRADAHDAGVKTVLGHRLDAGRGIEDGEEVLDIVARHPATAAHLARQLAVRFVADQPPQALVDRLAERYLETDGDLRALLVALVESPEFWRAGAADADASWDKVKSPFELMVSSLRALEADVVHPGELVEWTARMGQPLYSYAAPTGYPDRADFWVNGGALLNRMNFGLALAAGRIRGVYLDLAHLVGHREPASRQDALAELVPLLLPERPVERTLDLLAPMVGEEGLETRLAAAAADEPSAPPAGPVFGAMELDPFSLAGAASGSRRPGSSPPIAAPPTPLQQVVGLILGSPEFQRR